MLWSPTGKLTWSRIAFQLLGRVCLQMPELGPLPPFRGRHEGIADVTNRKGRGRRQAQVAWSIQAGQQTNCATASAFVVAAEL